MSRRRFVGIGLVLAALVLHFWNARRDARPLSYAEARVAPADRIDPSLYGRVVSVTAPLETSEILEDARFGISGRWLRLVIVTGYIYHRMHLKVHGPRTIRDDMEFDFSIRDVNPVGPVGKQIDSRCAK